MNYEEFNDFDNDYNNMINMNYLKEENNFSAIKEIPEEENKMDVEESYKKNNNNKNENENENNKEELNYDLLKNKKKNKNKKKKNEIEKNNFEFPDVNKLDELSLKEECRKYGIKNNNIKNMKNSLEEIYNFLKNKILPQNLKNDLDNFLNEDYNKNSNYSQNNLKNDKNFLSEDKKNLIVNVIKNNKEIWGKILLFKSLDLKDVKKVLNENKITVSNNQLKELLNNFGVVLDGGWKK
jgi:hypothetical protein